VVAINEDAIRTLASFRGKRAPVTTCYLNVDGRSMARPREVEIELERVLRDARRRANGTASVARDLDRIEAYVHRGIDRSRTKGLAMFSCSDDGFWEVVPLPVTVRSRVVIGSGPAVSQLERMVHELDSFGVLLADRQRLRMFVFQMGELTDHTEQVDELPRDYDAKGEKDVGDHHGHLDALTSRHLRDAAAAAFAVYQKRGFEHFTIGCPDALVAELESHLHPYLRDRLAPRIAVEPAAGVEQIRQAAMEVELAVDRRAEAVEVDRLRSAVATNQRGVNGLSATLAALSDKRVQTLLVSDGYSESGWRCEPCGRLTTMGRSCPSCEQAMEPVDDVVEEALDMALSQSCRVRLCVDNADLDVLGRVGAVLHY